MQVKSLETHGGAKSSIEPMFKAFAEAPYTVVMKTTKVLI